MAKKKTKQEQIALAEELQGMLLEDFKRLLESGEATAADRATMTRMLTEHGWDLDPSRGGEIKPADLLTRKVDPRKFDDDDEAAMPRIAGSIGR